MYKTMLVPLDRSELAEVVLTYVKELAVRLGIDIILLHVCQDNEPGCIEGCQSYIEQAADRVRQQATSVQEGIETQPQTKAIAVSVELATGDPAEEILRFAEENDVSMIIMATHGFSGVRRWPMGGVADKVVRAAKVPVWLARAGIPDEVVYDKWPNRTLLVPLDGSELAESVIPHAEALARQRGAELVEIVLLWVCEPVHLPSYVLALKSIDWDGFAAQANRLCERYLDGVAQRLKTAGLKARYELLEGNAAETIVDYANEHPFNLVLMATHGRSGLSRWVFGSVTQKVLQGIPSPMFLVRPNGVE